MKSSIGQKVIMRGEKGASALCCFSLGAGTCWRTQEGNIALRVRFCDGCSAPGGGL